VSGLLLVAPLLVSCAGVLLAWWVPKVASPATCVRTLTAAAVLSAASILAALVLVMLAAASRIHSVSHLLHWCDGLVPGPHGVSLWAGVAAGLALGFGCWRAAALGRVVARERRHFAAVRGVHVVEAAGPTAFAVPGRPGGIVLGRALLAELRADERAAVLAHERAHLELGHHRYVLAAELAAAAFPFLGLLARQVRFNTERWADEAAAAHLGSRSLVARAIARAALLGEGAATPRLGLAVAHGDTVARVHALVHPRRTANWPAESVSVVAALLVAFAGTSVQVHHLAAFVMHICPT